MINKDLYPTPDSVIEMMLFGTDLNNSIILDPSAGFGNILDYVKQYTDSLNCYEIESRLQSILLDKKYKLLGSDFLTSEKEDIAHITHIIMNPPFSKDVEHILHAFEIAPEGCEVIALCNYESLKNDYSYSRRKLLHVIEKYGLSQNLGSVFIDSERTTNVEVGLIKLYKPIISKDFDYSIFFTKEEEEEQQNGLLQYNEVRAIVNNYVGVLKEFDIIHESIERLNKNSKRSITINFGDGKSFTDKETFAKELQKQEWRVLFNRFNMRKYLTSKMMEKVNKMVETQSNIPFTMRNVYTMLDMIYQTRHENLQNALVEAVDNFTQHTHKNRYMVEGWKTNLGHMLNRKIIINNAVDYNLYRRVSYSQRPRIEDLLKAMCNICGEDFSQLMDVNLIAEDKEKTSNTWYDFKRKDGTSVFFRYKFFKKGTLHLEFLDVNQWKLLNSTYGKIKGNTLF